MKALRRILVFAVVLATASCNAVDHQPSSSASSPAKSRPVSLPEDSGPLGPSGDLFGDGGRARRIVFVCEGSGSMIATMRALRENLGSEIEDLQEGQAFNILFFNDSIKHFIAAADGLIPVSDQSKEDAFRFLADVTASGVAEPTAAITAGLKMKPDLLYFLVKGDFDNVKSYPEILAAIDEANPGHRIRINTIQFSNHDVDGEKILQRIARENGGSYRFVGDELLEPSRGPERCVAPSIHDDKAKSPAGPLPIPPPEYRGRGPCDASALLYCGAGSSAMKSAN